MIKVLYILICFSFILTTFIPTASAESKFRDIKEAHWAKEEIDFLSSKNIISGYSGGVFAPNENITREQAALMLGRILNLGVSGPSNTIIALIKLNILEKEAATNRNDYMTRKEMAKALSVAYSLKGENKLKFSDVAINDSYYPYIDALAKNGITQGYKDGTFKPNDNITRAQFSVFVTKAIKLGIEPIDKSDTNVSSTIKESFTKGILNITNNKFIPTMSGSYSDYLEDIYEKIMVNGQSVDFNKGYFSNEVNNSLNSKGVGRSVFYIPFKDIKDNIYGLELIFNSLQSKGIWTTHLQANISTIGPSRSIILTDNYFNIKDIDFNKIPDFKIIQYVKNYSNQDITARYEDSFINEGYWELLSKYRPYKGFQIKEMPLGEHVVVGSKDSMSNPPNLDIIIPNFDEKILEELQRYHFNDVSPELLMEIKEKCFFYPDKTLASEATKNIMGDYEGKEISVENYLVLGKGIHLINEPDGNVLNNTAGAIFRVSEEITPWHEYILD